MTYPKINPLSLRYKLLYIVFITACLGDRRWLNILKNISSEQIEGTIYLQIFKNYDNI